MKRAASRPDFPLRHARQVRALRSPARQELVDALQAAGPCSIAALGELLGRAPDSLYYHVRALERVGLIVKRGVQRSGARDEALYDTPGRLILDFEPQNASERRDLLALTRSVLRIAERDLRAAVEGGTARYARRADRNTWCARVKGWLTPDELTAVREHLEAAAQLLVQGQPRRGAELHALAFALAPLAPTPRSRSARTPTR